MSILAGRSISSHPYEFCHADLVLMFGRLNALNHSNLIALFVGFDESNNNEMATNMSTTDAIMDQSSNFHHHEIKTELNVETVADDLLTDSSGSEADSNDHGELKPTEYESLLKLMQNNNLIFNTDPFECGHCSKMCQPMCGILLQDCLHSVCCDCIRAHICLNAGNEKVTCLYSPSCDGFVQPQEIKALLTAGEFADYEYKRVKK